MFGEKWEKRSRILCLGFLLCFFLTQYFLFGYERFADTGTLEDFSPAVYPLYPLALYFFRTVFGVDTGYYLLGMVQNIVLALSIFALTDYLRSTFSLSSFLFWGASVAVALMFLIQKWATATGTVASNTLFSEALAIPFYLLFFRYALESFLCRNRKPFWLSCIWATLLILTRGQFYWVLIIIALNGMRLAEPGRIKALFCAVLACIGSFASVQSVRYLQTSIYLTNNEDYREINPADHIVLTTAVYCSEKNDYQLFEEGSGEWRLLKEVRPWMDDPERQAALSYETGDLIQRQKKFEYEYDNLQREIRRVYGQITAEGTGVSKEDITRTLILANLPSFLRHCGQNFWVGLIRTVALLRKGLDVYAIGLYLLMLSLSVTSKESAFKAPSRFLFLGLLCTFFNVIVMAPGVFAQSRYVFYNMPVLYLGLGVYAANVCACLARRLRSGCR
ncbi:MAG: hypothetical protein E7442_02145 [Ruminococcaceae bacterium]|nr:hypothetical protein [Oscillospiraceae bacterium]